MTPLVTRLLSWLLLGLGGLSGTVFVADLILSQPWAETAALRLSYRRAHSAIHVPEDDRRQNAADFLEASCQHVAPEHEQLVTTYLRPWARTGVHHADLAKWPGHLYLNATAAYVGEGLEMARLMPTYLRTLEALWRDVALPPVDLPLNAADEPLSEHSSHVPIMSFCRTPDRADILIPNLLEGEPVSAQGLPTSRAGPKDPRRPTAVWRGTIIDAYQGVTKGRWALLELGRTRPDVIDSGVVAWNEERYGPDEGRVKMRLSFKTQVDEHRYSVWVPGNCASVRLAKLLASDTVVMKLVSPEIEWYYPLLQPGRHYLPVWVKGNDTGLPEAVAWARSHPTAAARMVEAANEFALRHLSPLGRSCYITRLLVRWHSLLAHAPKAPESAKLIFPTTPRMPPPLLPG